MDSTVDVILRNDLPGVGAAGETVSVNVRQAAGLVASGRASAAPESAAPKKKAPAKKKAAAAKKADDAETPTEEA